MNWRLTMWVGLAALGLLILFGGGWLFVLPAAPAAGSVRPMMKVEADATVAALQPPKRLRPLIAIIGINDATETTDFMMPYGILHRANVADVTTLSTKPGPIKLYPALKVDPHETVDAFDNRNPDGADYVIVPAMSRSDDPVVLSWIKSQSAKGAIIIGICAGAKIVAAAGLLHGKRATTHWYYLDELLEIHPSVRYVEDRRLVVDGNVATTTGITASIPAMLTLIEAIAGKRKAAEIARSLGVSRWDLTHDSGAFQFTRPFALTMIGNSIAIWNQETLGLELMPGIDEVSLALVSDAWSRTYRSQVVSFAKSAGSLPTRGGLHVIPDRVASTGPKDRLISQIVRAPAAQALDRSLRKIGERYGPATAAAVAMQLETRAPETSGPAARTPEFDSDGPRANGLAK